MPVAGEVKIQISGKLPSGEIWSTGFQIGGATITSQSDLATLLGAVQTGFAVTSGLRAWMVSKNPSGFTIENLAAYYYASNGPATYQASVTDTGAGSSVSPPLPNQCAVVASLRTSRPGRSFRGRMYLPLLCIGNASGQVTTADTTGTANAVKTTFQTINGGAGGYSVAVASTRQNAMTHVTGIIVDSLIDTQRRRSQSEAALYRAVVTGL